MPPIANKVKVNPRYAEKDWDTDDAGQWYEQRLSWKDPIFQVAATTINYDITGFPAGAVIVGAFFRATQNWAGGTLASATFSAGTTGAPTAYIAATSVFTGAPIVKTGTTLVPGTFVNAASPLLAGTIRTQLILSANGTNLTTGYIDFYFWLQFFKLRAT
jgi:hypothetical protein